MNIKYMLALNEILATIRAKLIEMNHKYYIYYYPSKSMIKMKDGKYCLGYYTVLLDEDGISIKGGDSLLRIRGITSYPTLEYSNKKNKGSIYLSNQYVQLSKNHLDYAFDIKIGNPIPKGNNNKRLSIVELEKNQLGVNTVIKQGDENAVLTIHSFHKEDPKGSLKLVHQEEVDFVSVDDVISKMIYQMYHKQVGEVFEDIETFIPKIDKYLGQFAILKNLKGIITSSQIKKKSKK